MTAVAEVSQARPLMPVEQALEQLLALAEAAPIRETENLPLAEAEGRVLATDLVASLDLPPWPNSAMDGYALRLADWQGQPLPVSQRIFAGHAPSRCNRVPARGSSPARLCRRGPTASRCRKTPKYSKMAGCAFSKRCAPSRTYALKVRRPARASR